MCALAKLLATPHWGQKQPQSGPRQCKAWERGTRHAAMPSQAARNGSEPPWQLQWLCCSNLHQQSHHGKAALAKPCRQPHVAGVKRHMPAPAGRVYAANRSADGPPHHQSPRLGPATDTSSNCTHPRSSLMRQPAPTKPCCALQSRTGMIHHPSWQQQQQQQSMHTRASEPCACRQQKQR